MNFLTDYPIFRWYSKFRKNRLNCSLLIFAALALLPFLAAPALQAQSFTGLGVPTLPGGVAPEAVFPYGVSDDGTAVAGTIRYPIGSTFVYEAFRWEDGLFTLLGDLPGAQQVGSQGQGISGDGSLVVGWGYWHFTPPAPAGFVHDGVDIAEVGGTKEIRAISENGAVMVGRSVTKEYPVGDETEIGYEAVRIAGGTVQGLGHLPWVNPDPVVFEPEFESIAHGVSADGSIVVGESSVTIAVQEAFIWQNGSMVGLGWLPSEFAESKAYDVSNDGSVVVGISEAPQIGTTAVRWVNRQIQTLSQFGQRSWAWAVSGDGKIIVGDVWSGEASIDLGSIVIPNSNAFIWTEDGEARLLKDVFENDYGLNLTGWQQLLSARDISDDGSMVVGWGINSEGQLEGWRAELSPLERALIVNRTGDEADHDLEDDACDINPVEVGNQCTLRAAIETANARQGIDGITFEIEGAGPHTITLGAALPALTEPVVIDATTQPGYTGTPLIQLTGTSEIGLDLSVGETRVRGLAIGGFSVAGIHITGPGKNVVEASYLGVAADGTSTLPNGIGLLIEGSPDNVIGRGPEDDEGTQAKRLRAVKNEEEINPKNVISGNTGAGLILRGSESSGNVVAGNHIGTNAAGDAALSNGAEGVMVDGAKENMIGGNIQEARNLISGNEAASVWIMGESARDNHIAGNFIGIDVSGSSALGNKGPGVSITGSPGNTIGGEEPSSRNIISGNKESGILIEGAASDANTVIGNYIGTNSAGNAAIPNETEGVRIMGAPNSRIGTEVLGNVIAGNGGIGVWVSGHLAEGHSDGTMVLNNVVGLDASGEVSLLNGGESVIRLDGAARQSKVGQAGAGNVIAGNEQMTGVDLLDFGEEIGAPDGTQVAGNSIGISKSGKKLDDYPLFGVALTVQAVDGGGTQGVVGGEDAASGNRINGPVVGILVEGERSSNSVVAYNVIGNMDKTLPEDERDPVGIWINGANQIQIASNTVGGQGSGIVLGSNKSTLTFNKIGTNVAASAARPNSIGLWIPGEVGPKSFSTGDGNMIGTENGANVISGNTIGVLLGGSFNPFPVGKAEAGKVEINSSIRDNLIGSSTEFRILTNLSEPTPDSLKTNIRAKQASFNQTEDNGQPDNNIFRLNRIGTNFAGDREIGNGRADSEDEAFAAVRIESGINNRLIGNLISGNGGGVYVGPDSDFKTYPANTLLAGNTIGGSLASESANLPNQYGGVFIFNTTGTRLTAAPITAGGDPVGNIIRGNGVAGVQIGLVDSDDVGNQVRQSSFFDNDGPSIVLLNAQFEYPSMAPEIPRILSAAALPGNASVRFASSAAGVVDGLVSQGCDDGYAQGRYAFSIDVEPGTAVVDLPYNRLDSDLENATSLFLALTITSASEAGMTSEFSECYRIASENDVESTTFSINDEGELINGAGIKVEINSNAEKQSINSEELTNSNPSSEGMLYVARYRTMPVDRPIDGAAESADGTMVTPDMASEDRYWSLQSTGIDSISYRVCLDIEELPGGDVPEQLVVLHRRSASQSWKPYNSTLENGQLCAGGLTRFGEIGIGGSGDVNYLPVEPIVIDLPTEFELKSNYPNPFNPSTVIPYSLPEAAHVKIEVYDMTGRKTAALIDSPMSAGEHEITFNAGNLASGMYIIRFDAGGFTSTQKIMLIK